MVFASRPEYHDVFWSQAPDNLVHILSLNILSVKNCFHVALHHLYFVDVSEMSEACSYGNGIALN